MVSDGHADYGQRGLVAIGDGQVDSGQRGLLITGDGQADSGHKMVNIIDLYERVTHSSDLFRYGRRERLFHPSDKQAVSRRAMRHQTVHLTGGKAFSARVNSRSVQDCFADVHRHVFVVLIMQNKLVVHRSGALILTLSSLLRFV